MFYDGMIQKAVILQKMKGFSKKVFKDTLRENAPSNKTPLLMESMNMDIWFVGILNQLLTRGS